MFDEVAGAGALAAELHLCAPSDLGCLGGVALDPEPEEFRLPGDPIHAWDLAFTGSFNGNATLTFGYDESLLDPNLAEADLEILHFSGGEWSAIRPKQVDEAANTIRVAVDGFSLFALGAFRDLDPFVVYRIRTTRGSARFTKLGPVTLVDQLGAADYEVRKPKTLGVPAREIGEEVPPGAIHLEEYPVKAVTGTPRFETLTGVRVANGCNDLYLELKKPVSLLVPTAKSPAGPVPAPGPDTHGVDHYVCYKAKAQRRLEDGTLLPRFPKGIQVLLEDQLQSRRYDLENIAKLCVPAAKSGDPVLLSGSGKGTPFPISPAAIRRPELVLLCYKARLARNAIPQDGCGPADPSDRGTPMVPRQEKHVRRIGIHTANQLGTEQIDTVKELEVCLSSERILPGP